MGDFSSCCFKVCLIENQRNRCDDDYDLLSPSRGYRQGTWESFSSEIRLHWVDLNLSSDTDAYKWEIKNQCRQFFWHSRISFVVTTKKREKKKKARLEKKQTRTWEKKKISKKLVLCRKLHCITITTSFDFLFGFCLVDHFVKRKWKIVSDYCLPYFGLWNWKRVWFKFV